MAGERYIGTDDQGRPRYVDANGRQLPPTFRPRSAGAVRPASPSGRVTAQLSERSRATVGDTLVGGALGRLNQSLWGRRPTARTGLDAVAGGARSGLGALAGEGALIGQAFGESRQPYGGYVDPADEARGYRGYQDAGAGVGGGDAEKILRGMAPERLVRLQERLVGAGYMSGGTVSWGNPSDGKTLDGFRSLLGHANNTGASWEFTLMDVERLIEETGLDADGAGDDGPAPFVAPTYTAPDYATLAQRVKEQMRDTLGRDPDESEMALLTAELAGWDRDAFDAEVTGQQAYYDAQVAAGKEGTEGLSGGTVQGVDPLARFQESFESKFAGEIRGIERTEEAAETGEFVRGATSTLSRMSGGMG